MALNTLLKNIFKPSINETDKYIIYDNQFKSTHDIIENRPYIKKFHPELMTIDNKTTIVILLDNNFLREKIESLAYDYKDYINIVKDKSIDNRVDGYLFIN